MVVDALKQELNAKAVSERKFTSILPPKIARSILL
jgi:hypothetical protein